MSRPPKPSSRKIAVVCCPSAGTGSSRHCQSSASGGGSRPVTGPTGEPNSHHRPRSDSCGWASTSVGLFSRASPSPPPSDGGPPDRDGGPPPGPSSDKQGGQHAGQGVHPGSDVGDRDTGVGRRVRPAGNGTRARLGLDQQVVSTGVLLRATPAVAGNVHGDQPGVPGAQLGGVQAEPGGRSRRQVLHQDIGGRPQPPPHLPTPPPP